MIRRDGKKVYIEAVRKVSWDTGEMSEFASCLVAALESLGDPVSYPFVMGTSGISFRFTLAPGEWDFRNYSFRNMTPDPDTPVMKAFTAAGYFYITYEPGSYQEDAARIMDSIDRGIPVLAFPVVGPSDCCIITGYDEDGQVLLGWSTFQNIPDDHDIPPDVTGYFRKPGWHENLHGYILSGDKVDRTPLRDIYVDSLKDAIRLLRVQQMQPKLTGLEGLRAWADEMVQEKYFPTGDDETIGWRYVSAAINMTMLRDHLLAVPFLSQVIEDVPAFRPELSQAILGYGEVTRLRAEMEDLIDDLFSEKAMSAIKDAEIRRKYADLILRICKAEDEALKQIEKLITRIS